MELPPTVRIVSNGTADTTRVILPDGSELPMVQAIRISVDLDSVVTADIRLVGVSLDVVAKPQI